MRGLVSPRDPKLQRMRRLTPATNFHLLTADSSRARLGRVSMQRTEPGRDRILVEGLRKVRNNQKIKCNYLAQEKIVAELNRLHAE